jgi:Na+/H+ antiporter NhaC
MENFGFWSILPPLVAIILAIKTRQVFISLLFGIWMGWVILSNFNFLNGTINTIEAMVDVFKEPGNTRTIMFSSLVGALIAFIQRSGGVEGFIHYINNFLEKVEKKRKTSPRKTVQIMAWLTGVAIFVESSINVLTVGAIYRPIFDRLKIPREKLAYIADSISAPTCILIPLNAWGAYIMGLLLAQGISNPLGAMVKAYPLNFYPIFAMIIVVIVIFTQKDIGPMKRAEKRALEEGKVIRDGATPMISTDVISMEKDEKTIARARNQIENIHTYPFWQQIFLALGKGSGSTAVLWAVLTSILVGAILYRFQKIFKFPEIISLIFKGVGGLIPLALLMMLAFAIGKVCRDLGTGVYVAEVTKTWLSPKLVPVIVYLVASFIAFSTGTSWGTFAIMIPIGLQMAQIMDANIYLTIAAALGGGVFGDHSSPISDTTIISSMASASDHIDHVKTQLPYALFAGFLAAIVYLVVGIMT